MSTSVHFALTITSRDPGVSLHFAWIGLEAIVGRMGALSLRIHEACNLQSNLDTLPQDIGEELMAILQFPGQVSFLQLYVTSPHAHLQMAFKHPFSGAIMNCGLRPHMLHKVLGDQARTYMEHE